MPSVHLVRAEPTVTMLQLGSASDATLVAAIGQWNEAALAEAYHRHGSAVHAIAQRILGTDGRAQEVTQEVFAELWNRPDRFDPSRGSLRSFLATVAHARAVDLIRSDTARTAREQRIARETAIGGYDLENHVWDLALVDHVKNAIDALPDMERRALELAYFGGHTYREVGIMLGEAEGTIKSRIRRALNRLRHSLVDEMDAVWT